MLSKMMHYPTGKGDFATEMARPEGKVPQVVRLTAVPTIIKNIFH